jgi:hypothetical protein
MEAVPVLEREGVVVKRTALAMAAVVGALMRTAVAMVEVVVVVKRTTVVIEAAAVASKTPAAAKMAGSLKAFDPREKSKSGKGGC